MTDEHIQELTAVIQSSHINFLLGAGVSQPFLTLLNDIEKKIDDAESDEERIVAYKEYLEGAMLPNIKVVEGTETSDAYTTTKENYTLFFQAISNILLERKSTILSKQANIFTTNIDVMMETVLEELSFDYSDGFCGRFTPTYSLANYKKSSFQRSLHFDHISEIPVFNLLKLHGSVTWKFNADEDEMAFSQGLEHFSSDLLSKDGNAFEKEYKRILVINPQKEKHIESIIDMYYSELLRLYSNELEKENAVLFVIGFSMEDKHIREITLRAAKSNPTLRVYVFCHSKEKGGKDAKELMEKKLKTEQHSNIQVVSPIDNKKPNRLNLRKITEDCFAKVLKPDTPDDDE